jgi:hypothetical protein
MESIIKTWRDKCLKSRKTSIFTISGPLFLIRHDRCISYFVIREKFNGKGQVHGEDTVSR